MTFLRTVLTIDAVTCVATGLLLSVGATRLSPLLGLPVDLLITSGLSLLPFAAFLLIVARRPTAPTVWLVIALNALWVVDSLLVAFGGFVDPTPLGVAFVVVQALAVAGLAGLELVGLRRADGVTA